MQHLEGSGTPVLYIGRKVLKGFYKPAALVCYISNVIEQLMCGY